MKCSFHEIQHFPQPSVGPLGSRCPTMDQWIWAFAWRPRLGWRRSWNHMGLLGSWVFVGSFWTWICWLAHFGKLHGWQPTNKLVVKDSKWMVGELFGTCVMGSFLDALRKEFRPCCKRTVLKKHQDLMKSPWLNPFLRLLAPFEKPGWVIYCHGTSCGGVSCQACCRAGYNRHDGVDRNQKSR